MFNAQFDNVALDRKIRESEGRRFPVATRIALNDAAFATRTAWGQEIDKVFDRPTTLTRKAVLVKKATADRLQAEVFIRNEAAKGTPPSRYLFPQVQGGQRDQKPSEYLLASRSVFPRQHFVPGRGIRNQLDSAGNIPAGIIKRVISQLGAARDVGVTSNESAKTRTRRLRRQRKKGGGGSYFVLPKRRGKLSPGVVYERITTAQGSAVRSVLYGVTGRPTYRPRLNVYALAQMIFRKEYALRFARAMRGLRGA